MNENVRTTRFSGADWADQLKPIMVIGAGGISSWTILNLSRIGHTLYIIDPDTVDETNVTGGQMYRQKDIGKSKVEAVVDICREFGCINQIDTIQDYYSEDMGTTEIMICGLDNMKARKDVFEAWLKGQLENNITNCLFIDGRLTVEMYEVFTIHRVDEQAIERYKQEHLFDDSEANEVDCTTKQSTFGAMGIASLITGTLCNWLTNQKNRFDIREVPFYHRLHLPLMQQKHSNQIPTIIERIVEKEVAVVGIQEAYNGELEKLRNFHACVGSLHTAALKPKQPEVHIHSNLNKEVWEKL